MLAARRALKVDNSRSRTTSSRVTVRLQVIVRSTTLEDEFRKARTYSPGLPITCDPLLPLPCAVQTAVAVFDVPAVYAVNWSYVKSPTSTVLSVHSEHVTVPIAHWNVCPTSAAS